MRHFRNKIKTRVLAGVLCLSMAATMFSGVGLFKTVSYAAAAGQTEHIVENSRVADPDTMDDYVNRLLTETTGSRYAGRVWTDKSVFAFGDSARKGLSSHFDGTNKITLDMATDGYIGDVLFNSDFAHVFSALASSQVVNEYPPSPVDLVIVFDMSGSMGQDTRYSIDPGYNTYQEHTTSGDSAGQPWPATGVPMADRIKNSRIQKTLDAINTTIDKLMAQNPQNRVAVCGYGENAVVLMPLGHYRHADNDEDVPYLSVGGMETLYHPSDLVYRTVNDGLKKNGVPLEPVTEAGWYWMNNRDTCYTVVVNAQTNNYTGVLDNDGDKDGEDPWHPVQKTVSNNVLDSEGNTVKAFPGVADQNEEGNNETNRNKSRTIYEASSTENNTTYDPQKDALRNDMSGTQALQADDYVGYFTNTQGGIYLAYKQLADSTATTYTEELSNGVISTVARIPAAIIMSDGGANFAFNAMGDSTYRVKDWNLRYGQKLRESAEAFNSDETPEKSTWKEAYGDGSKADSWYMNDNSWSDNAYGVTSDDVGQGKVLEGFYEDYKHRLNQNTGDEWYKVFLPGNDTLIHDPNPDTNEQGYWKGLEGIYNTGADYFKDGTLSTPPVWNYAGVLYSSDNDPIGTSGAVLEVLLTAAYMNYVVKEHYNSGWTADDAAVDSRIPLSTYTMNVDTVHVPQWGKLRLYPTLNPSGYPLDTIQDAQWYKDEKFGDDNVFNNVVTKEMVYNGIYESWNEWKTRGTTRARSLTQDVYVTINSIKTAGGDAGNYTTQIATKDGETLDNVVSVTDEDVIANIKYNNDFFDVTSEAMGDTFEKILALILGNVFVPVSGDNDAGVGDSITYQDPIGEYMEIKNEAIVATPHHTDKPATGEGTQQTYDMAILLFGEMHGLVRAGVYDFNWNDQWMKAKGKNDGVDPFPEGWYKGTPEEAANAPLTDPNYLTTDAAGTWPKEDPVTHKKYASAQEARDDGWVMRFNFSTLLQFVPIVDVTNPNVHPSDLPEQVKNTVYTCYRFAGTQEDRNELRRNPIYGEGVPEAFTQAWNEYYDENQKYPDRIEDLTEIDTKEYPGIYRLSDIRVWVEDTGDFVDTDGAIAPNSGYDRSLYVNIPAAAIPTELATITLGRDGVLSYETNLGKDHPVGSQITVEVDGEKVEQTVDEAMYKNFCYQSTPFRLFYAVGLEEDLILRDDAGNQTGVDFNAISPEYISSHGVEENNENKNYVWFISNYYSETRYDEYATDTVSRTRGDPTVTFSPGSDNRYYVFQKPLPLFAHAYRASGSGLTPVDNVPGGSWGANRSGNGKTTWENSETGGASWTGGQYMGTYNTQQDFLDAENHLENRGGVQYITDSSNIKYEYVENGIVFLQEDMLRHVTSTEGGYTGDSVSFSSDDYFFLLVEFYVPYPGKTGKDNYGKEVPGTQGGHMVQFALARKGSEFGSGFASSEIDNGDMLCWTDAQNHLNLEFDYLSKTDTGDRTRGEPTWEKLTYKDDVPSQNLRTYLQTTCGIKDEGVLKEQVEYWLKMQKDPLVVAALKAAAGSGDTPSEEEFNKYFSFSVAARPGGIRSGDMANNLQYKGDRYDSAAGYYNNNVTRTSNTYYLPTVSDNSGTDNDVIINNYLGNNGRLEIANQMLHVTKMLEPPAGYELTDAQKKEVFNYQIFVQGVTGKRTAVRTEYNEYSETWERELAYIDVLTDNSDLVQTNDSTRALFVLETVSGSVSATTARQVVAVDGVYYYANEDGTQGTETVDPGTQIYYLYLPSNGTAGTDTQHVRRLYQSEDYNGTDKLTSGLEKNGTTTFVRDGDPTTPAEPGLANRNSLRPAEDGRPAGTRTYWAMDAELIPMEQVQMVESGNALSGVTWQHDPNKHGSENHETLTYQTFVIRRPNNETSETNFTSPFQTRSAYLTVELNFGYNANEKDGSTNPKGPMTTGDLYDGTVPSVDRPDLFNETNHTLSLDDIAAHTAEFTLKHGEGLLLTGLQNRVSYRFTEKLTDAQLKMGYTLKEIGHVQQRGSLTTYAPGANEFTDLGVGFSVEDGGETYFHTNAKLIESYSTMSVNANHHAPGTNPACEEGKADMGLGDGTIRHYFVRDGELVDKHYTGDGVDSSRYVVNATAHFGVKNEPTEEIVTTRNARTDYTGVYSVFGNTGWFEEQVNYTNTFETGDISITKELEPYDGSELTEKDKETAFSFTLALNMEGILGTSNGVYDYTVRDKDGKAVKTGRLLPKTAPEGLDPPEDTANDIRLNEDNTWHFTLKGGETMTVLNLAVDAEYTYTVTETSGDGYVVEDSDEVSGDSTDGTVKGTVEPGSKEPAKVKFTNTKKPPEPAVVDLELTKNVDVIEGDYKLEKDAFRFTVTPAKNNPEGDPIKETYVVSNGESEDGISAFAKVFDKVQFEKVGDYRYTVREEIPNPSEPGISYDPAAYTVTVHVEEDYGDDPANPVYLAQLKATVTCEKISGDTGESAVFTNEFNPNEIKVVLRAHKTLVSANDGSERPVEVGQFEFKLTGADISTTPGPETVAQDTPPQPDGETLPTPEETPGEPGNGLTGENPWSGGTWVPDSPSEDEPEESDNPWMFLSTARLAEEPQDEPLPQPEEPAPPEPQPEAPAQESEDLNGGLMTTAAIPDVPMPDDGGDVARNALDGYANFGAIRFTEPGTYTYRIVETAGSEPGIEYDMTVYTVTVEVTRSEKNGALQAEVTYVSEAGGTLLAEFRNRVVTGDLTVEKTVAGPAGETDREFAFTVTLDPPPVQGKYGDMEFDENGVASFTLKHGEKKTAQGLPAGTKYTVTETPVEGYTAQAENDTGEIPNGGEAAARFVNTRDKEPGSLTVTKSVTGTGDKTKRFHFTVTVDPPLNGRYGDMEFVDGVASFTLADGESATATDLPADTVYTVTEAEANADGYTTTAEGGSGTIPEGGTATAKFVNDMPTPELTPTPPPTDWPMPTPNTSVPPKETPIPVPPTGDTRNAAGWLAVTFLSAAGFLFTWQRFVQKRSRRATAKHIRR